VAGITFSANFPTTSGAFDTSFDGDSDAFLLSISGNLARLASSTFLGRNSGEAATAMSTVSGLSVYVAGGTSSADFPTTPDAFDTSFSLGEGFIAKFFFITCGGSLAAIIGTGGDDVLNGTPRPDVIHGLGGDDTINGLGGNDIICGGPGNDMIRGGAGRNRLFGQGGHDRLHGGLDDDRLSGGPGNDRLFGESGDDVMDGGIGADSCDGGSDTAFGIDTATGCETVVNVP